MLPSPGPSAVGRRQSRLDRCGCAGRWMNDVASAKLGNLLNPLQKHWFELISCSVQRTRPSGDRPQQSAIKMGFDLAVDLGLDCRSGPHFAIQVRSLAIQHESLRMRSTELSCIPNRSAISRQGNSRRGFTSLHNGTWACRIFSADSCPLRVMSSSD